MQNTCLDINVTNYTFMQNISLKGKKVQYFIEKMRSCRVQNWRLGGNLRGYTFMQKSKIKSTKYHKIKFDTSLKSYGHAESKILGWEQFL